MRLQTLSAVLRVGLRVLSIVALLIVSACAVDRQRTQTPGAESCLLVDSDAAIDDFRAITALMPTGRVAAIVATAGVASPERGASAIAHLVAASPRTAGVPLVIGASSTAPSPESWLPAARANAERLNRYLAEAIPFASDTWPMEDKVAALVAGCAELRVVVIGPWTSFVRYAGRLGPALRQVIAQGLPLEDVPAGRPPGFNCRYDLAACRQAHEILRAAKLGIWVDVPRGVTPAYAPDAEMLSSLAGSGLVGTLAAALRANTDGWKDTLLTDDAAALYVLRPELFAVKGGHVEPTLSPEDFRRLWVAAANAGR